MSSYLIHFMTSFGNQFETFVGYLLSIFIGDQIATLLDISLPDKSATSTVLFIFHLLFVF